MTSEIPVTEARAQFSELVNRVGFGKEQVVLTRHGKPLVALVPAEALPDIAGDGEAPTTVLDLSSTETSPGERTLTIAAQAPPPPQA